VKVSTQLGSYLRYVRMGMSAEALATICGLPMDTINKMDQYAPKISAGTLLHLARGLSIGLCDILRAINIPTMFAKTYNTVKSGDCYVLNQNDLRELLDLAAKGGMLKAKTSPVFTALAEAQKIVAKARLSPDHQKKLNLADLQRAYEHGCALGKNDLRDYVEDLILTKSQGEGDDKLSAFAQKFGIAEESLHNLVGPLPVSSFTDVLQIDKDLALGGALASIAWIASEDQTGIFLDDNLEGSKKLAGPARGWNEAQREIADDLMMLDYLHRIDIRGNNDNWRKNLSGALKDMAIKITIDESA
jgi:hypothetical protein